VLLLNGSSPAQSILILSKFHFYIIIEYMKNNLQIQRVCEQLKFLEEMYRHLIKILPSFDITDKKILPYGLKSHTRSVSWLVKQVIT